MRYRYSLANTKFKYSIFYDNDLKQIIVRTNAFKMHYHSVALILESIDMTELSPDKIWFGSDIINNGKLSIYLPSVTPPNCDLEWEETHTHNSDDNL